MIHKVGDRFNGVLQLLSGEETFLYVIAGSRNMPLFFTYVNGRYQIAHRFGLLAARHLFARCSPGTPSPGDIIAFTMERTQLSGARRHWR